MKDLAFFRKELGSFVVVLYINKFIDTIFLNWVFMYFSGSPSALALLIFFVFSLKIGSTL
jgi:hypothetical protein